MEGASSTICRPSISCSRFPGDTDQSARHRILLIAYHFPPSAAVGGTRMANFAKWLPSSGWEPYVLTIRDVHVERMDPGRLRDPRGRGDRQGRRTAHRGGTARSLAIGRACEGHATFRGGVDSRSGPDRYRGEALSRRLKRYLLPSSFSRTMSEAGSCPRLRRLSGRFGGIASSGSCDFPPSVLRTPDRPCRQDDRRRRWIADFRDPWMTTGWKRVYPTCALSMRIEAWLRGR